MPQDEELTRDSTIALVSRITHPALVSGYFISKHKLANLQRYPYSVFSIGEATEIDQRIDEVAEQLDRAIEAPSLERMNEVLNLKQIRKSGCASPAMLSRLYTGRLKANDLEHLTERFQKIRQHMEG